MRCALKNHFITGKFVKRKDFGKMVLKRSMLKRRWHTLNWFLDHFVPIWCLMVTYTLTKIAIADSSSFCRFLEHCMWSNHKGRQNQQNKTHVVTSHLISQFQMQDSWKSRKASQMFTTAVKYPGIVTRSLAAKSLFPNHKK